jgi:predicted dehydrogenase
MSIDAGSYPELRFAAVGLDHRHIYDHVRSLEAAGARCVGYWTSDGSHVHAGFVERFPHVPRTTDRRRLFDDPSIQLIACAAVPDQRAGLAIEAMQAGKDVMVDKPGAITFDQLANLRRVQAETGRLFSVNFTERFETRSTARAGELVQAGAIGRVVHVCGFGPHRLNERTRPDWFFRRELSGGILVDIGAHQIDQFLFFTQSADARITAARARNVAHPAYGDLQDIGEVMIESSNALGYFRVDWFTPDGLPTWGDGRLTIVGTEGTIELRKYIDVAGRPGADHLFLVDKTGARYVDCSDAQLPYYVQLCRDVFDRTETAMPQAHCFKVCELALKAQELADNATMNAA